MSRIDEVVELYTEGKDLAKEPPRSIRTIASEIKKDWTKVNYAAKPYLDAMGSLDKITDKYYQDSGASVVSYFLANASSWRGEKAKAVKAELNKMLKSK